MITRRRLLETYATGLGGMALATLLGREAFASPVRGEAADPPPHHPPKARRAIQIFLQGGLSQVDSFDYKPELEKLHGKSVPGDATAAGVHGQGRPAAPASLRFQAARSKRTVDFRPVSAPGRSRRRIDGDQLDVVGHGQSHARHVRSQQRFSHAWLSLRRGPGFRTGWAAKSTTCRRLSYCPTAGRCRRAVPTTGRAVFCRRGIREWSSTPVVQPFATCSPPSKLDGATQAARFAAVAELNRRHLAERGQDDALESRMRSYELAARMQLAIPQATDLTQESAATLALYGVDKKECGDFARACLLARRLIEHGVRFVQLWSGAAFGTEVHWDAHGSVPDNHRREAGKIDQPVTALLRDLRQRGLLDDTLVIFNTEFGRTPYAESAGDKAGPGRDHNPDAFSVWLAGAGLKHGMAYGTSDEIGWKAAENPVGCARLPRHDPAPAGHRPHAADLLPQRHPTPTDQRAWPRADRPADVIGVSRRSRTK